MRQMSSGAQYTLGNTTTTNTIIIISRGTVGTVVKQFTCGGMFMVAPWNWADHYIFILWFVSSFFSSLNLSHRTLDATILAHVVWP